MKTKFEEYQSLSENLNLDNRNHNETVGNIYYYLRKHLESKNEKSFKILLDVRLDEDMDKSKKPNIQITLRDKNITIDVFSGKITDAVKKYANHTNDISEMFFYDYTKKKWYNSSTKENSLSKILQLDLSDTIK